MSKKVKTKTKKRIESKKVFDKELQAYSISKETARDLYADFKKGLKKYKLTHPKINKASVTRLIKTFISKNKKDIEIESKERIKSYVLQVSNYLKDDIGSKMDAKSYRRLGKNLREALESTISTSKYEQINKILSKYGDVALGKAMRLAEDEKDVSIYEFFPYEIEKDAFKPKKQDRLLTAQKALLNLSDILIKEDAEEIKKISYSLNTRSVF